MKTVGVVGLILLVGCKQTPSTTTADAGIEALLPAMPSAKADDDGVDLDPKLLASVCAKLTDVPRVAEKCGPATDEDGGSSSTPYSLAYSFKGAKGADDQATGLIAQVKITSKFEKIIASAAASGQHHCENEAHNITIEFVGKPTEIAELMACQRLKSIP